MSSTSTSLSSHSGGESRELVLPDSPPPFSVVTEHWQNQLDIPKYNAEENYSFGEIYEEAMFKLIHKHLELDTHERFAYVGSNKGSLAEKIKEKFCLLQPMVNIFPGLIHYEETPGQKLLPFRISHVGAEEYFRQLSERLGKNDEAPFDKILLKDSVEHFTNPAETFVHIIRTMAPMGRLLIIHRPGPMSTLPMFTEAHKKFVAEDSEEPYAKIIKNLQSVHVDVKWEIETLPIVMPKVKWLSMLKEQFPPQMEAISRAQIATGIRELTEGMLKYQGEEVEFFDRLLFVTATHPLVENGFPSIQRCGALAHRPFPGISEMKYSLKITPDIHKMVEGIENRAKESSKVMH
ncbi:hypothetical protein HOLleu_40902 [Holothuria leucospilota]|uniref:Uncharacterized protein n=1 Tax=Holothuria leucospilota TaxID=206669 RepID=A0A9Q1BDY2_HOLLE|nr:hypothetical protein HOLleu_40902 [Holothuria leucospilota]